MGFDKFGIVCHTTDTKIPEFITYLEKGQVMATKCRKCHRIYFPPKIDCTNCLSSNIEWVEVTGEGKLITYTVVHYGPVGFEDRVPYTIGIAEFNSGIKMMAMVSREIPENELTVGMIIKVRSVRIPPNRISYEFYKVAKMGA